MNTRAELLRDVLGLVERYGHDTIRDLARLLGAPELAADLAVVLRAAAEQAPPKRRKARKSSSDDATVAKSVEDVRPLALTLERRLRERSALPRLVDVVEFARRHQIPVGRPKSREVAVSALVRELKKMNDARLSVIEAEFTHLPPAGDDSLAEWSRIILPSRSKVERDPSE